MLTCVLKTQVNESKMEVVYWNVWIIFNIKLFNEWIILKIGMCELY